MIGDTDLIFTLVKEIPESNSDLSPKPTKTNRLSPQNIQQQDHKISP